MASQQYTESVELFRGVPFDTSYAWTLAPMPVSLKKKWLEGNCSYDTYDKLMHTKMNTVTGSGVLRLEVPNSEISTYNYVYVQSSHEPAYFAFVLGYTYINDGHESGSSVYELAIQKDVLMSHLTDEGDFKDCVILRHHSTNRFDNPWPQEDFGGTVVNLSFKRVDVETNMCYAVVQYIETTQEDEFFDKVTVCATTASGVPQGCSGYYIDPSSVTQLSDFIKDRAKRRENINAIYLVPRFLLVTPSEGGADLIDEYVIKDAQTVEIETRAAGDYDTVVKNKKCYYYPFDFMRFYNDMGQTMDLRWEWWQSKQGLTTKQIAVEGIAVPPVSVTCYPIGYLGASQNEGAPYGRHYTIAPTHCLTMGNYPVGSWLNDSYSAAVGAGRILDFSALFQGDFKAFGKSAFRKHMYQDLGLTQKDQIAQSGYEFGKNAKGVLTAAGVSGGLALAGGVVAGVASMAYEEGKAAYAAGLEVETLDGSTGGNSASYTNGHKYFHYSHMCLNSKDRMNLDKYFDKYGYNQGGVIAKPDPFGRERWCYIQTAGLTYVTPAANANEQTIINNAFNRGITLWMNKNTAATIGDFDQNNGEDTIPYPEEAADEYFGIGN